MNLLIPDTGLLVWMLIAFGTVFFVLAKWGFPMITGMVNDRKAFIDDSLDKARQATERLAKIQDETAEMLRQAQQEQGRILAEAQSLRSQMMDKARQDAAAEGQKLIAEARQQIEAEKESAVRDLRRQVALLSIEVSQRILRRNLDSDAEQQAMIDRLLDEVIDGK